ncbi:MAG TPA: helix-turn-helix transcriptional regulator [Solirubrobacteraceae bacterium]|nr:helix-turn-helix transcriptional regulator [Solirubrobacteraceae bacterium]
MSAKHAVLGLVIERPGYGYQLARRLQERCGAWGWEPSGVYGALDLLAREGNVRSERGKGTGASGRAAPRAIYEPTGRGKDYFRDWMLDSSPPSPVRQELDLKILFSSPEFVPGLIDQTWAQEQTCIDALRGLTSTMQPAGGRPSTWRDAAVVLQRDAEIKLLQVRIEWLQKARAVMRELLDAPVGGL